MTLVRNLALVALVTFTGCGGDETQLSPLPVPSAPPQDAGDAAVVPDAGAIVRTVEVRNPFGNTTRTDNFLVDGDFELTSGQGQFGWRSISQQGDETLVRETGGLCRSGVTCGVLTPSADFVAFGAAPRDAEIDVGVWAKPPRADCDVVSVSLISCSSLVVRALATVLPTAETPDETGWCHYQGVTPGMDEQPCVYVSAGIDAGERVLVDEAHLAAAPSVSMRHMAATVPPPALLRRMEHALRWIHEHKQFGRPCVDPPR